MVFWRVPRLWGSYELMIRFGGDSNVLGRLRSNTCGILTEISSTGVLFLFDLTEAMDV